MVKLHLGEHRVRAAIPLLLPDCPTRPVIDLRIAVLTRKKRVADIGAFARAMVYDKSLIDMIRNRGGGDPD